MHNLFEATQDSFTHMCNLFIYIHQVLPVIVFFQEGYEGRGIKLLEDDIKAELRDQKAQQGRGRW